MKIKFNKSYRSVFSYEIRHLVEDNIQKNQELKVDNWEIICDCYNIKGMIDISNYIAANYYETAMMPITWHLTERIALNFDNYYKIKRDKDQYKKE